MAQLAERQGELAAAGCNVVVLTFGEMSGARRWLEETHCLFPYFTEPTLSMYQKLGLKRSIVSVWNPAALGFYGAQMAKGTPLPKAYADIEDDPHQMGGDFIVDRHAKLEFIYHSKVPSDRPSVDLILASLKRMSQP